MSRLLLPGALRWFAERSRGSDGFSMVELLVAMMVLAVGILAALGGFTSAQKLSLISERHTTITQIAQREIERIEGMSYSQIALNATPSTSTVATNPDYYVVAGSPPTYEWNRGTSGQTEQLDIDTTNGQVAPVTAWSEAVQGGILSGQVYDFIT